MQSTAAYDFDAADAAAVLSSDLRDNSPQRDVPSRLHSSTSSSFLSEPLQDYECALNDDDDASVDPHGSFRLRSDDDDGDDEAPRFRHQLRSSAVALEKHDSLILTELANLMDDIDDADIDDALGGNLGDVDGGRGPRDQRKDGNGDDNEDELVLPDVARAAERERERLWESLNGSLGNGLIHRDYVAAGLTVQRSVNRRASADGGGGSVTWWRQMLRRQNSTGGIMGRRAFMVSELDNGEEEGLGAPRTGERHRILHRQHSTGGILRRSSDYSAGESYAPDRSPLGNIQVIRRGSQVSSSGLGSDGNDNNEDSDYGDGGRHQVCGSYGAAA